jgi:RNA polymerase sigma factor (sigma-70 family)
MTEELQIKYSRIYKKYVDDMYSYGLSFGIDKDMLMDIVHDVFLHVFEHGNFLREDGELKFYLLKSLKNRIISLNRNKIYIEDIDAIGEDYEFSISMSGFYEVEEAETRERLIQKTELMLQCLTGRQREAIYLYFKQELDYDEIALILNITTKGARKLIYRAIERIREKFGIHVLLLLIYLEQAKF